MSRNETIVASYDAYVSQDAPNKNFGNRSKLWVKENDPHSVRTFIYFPFDKAKYRRAIILSARLSLHHNGTNALATYAIRRVTQRWREGQVTWNDAPQVTNQGELQALGGGTDKERFDIDVTSLVQTWVSGAAVYGFRIHAVSNGGYLFYSSEAARHLQPKLLVVWNPAPDAPTNLHPAGGRAVSAAAPLFLWDSSTPTAVQVQIDAVGDFANPLFDSDWVVQDEEQYDTAVDPAPPSLADNTEYWWRVRIEDESAQASGFASPVNFERRSKGVLTLTSPGTTVQTTTPTITHTFTGRLQESVRYELLEDGQSVWVRPRAAQLALSFTLPAGLIRSNVATYTIIVQVWDKFDRVASDGDDFVEASKDFTFQNSAAIAPVTALTAAAIDAHILVTWSRSPAPDFFALRVNGELVADRIEPGEVSSGGTSYAMKFWNPKPGSPLTYVVEAVVFSSGVYLHSQANPTAAVTFSPVGIWVTDPESQIEVHVFGEEDADAAIGETGTTFFPLGRRDPVRLIDNVRGMEGSVSGTLITVGGRSAAFEYAGVMALKADPLATRRLIFGYVNIPVLLGEVTLPPTPIPEENYDVSFEFWQVSEFGAGTPSSGGPVFTGGAFDEGFDGGFG